MLLAPISALLPSRGTTSRLSRSAVRLCTAAAAEGTAPVSFPWRLQTTPVRSRSRSGFGSLLMWSIRDALAAHFLRVCAPSPFYFETDFLEGANVAVRASLQAIFGGLSIDAGMASDRPGSHDVTVWADGFQVNNGAFRDAADPANRALHAALMANPEQLTSGRVTDRRHERYSPAADAAGGHQAPIAEPSNGAVKDKGTDEATGTAEATKTDKPANAEVTQVSQVLMKDAFEASLARFYREALARSRAAGYRVHHRVERISPVEITFHDTIFNANRALASEMSRMVRHDFLSVIGNAEPADPADAGDPDNPLLESLQNCITGRVGLSVTCNEVFFVEEEASGRLLQGSRELQQGIHHEIVLECCLHATKKQFLAEWQVVDIDNWLNGNHFLSTRPISF